MNGEGEEDERELFKHSVDIPQVGSKGEPMEEWYCVEYFKTREEAIKYAQDHFGADEEGKVSLVSSW